MNCKNSAQNALKVTIFRLKIEKFLLGGGYPLHKLHPLSAFGASILSPAALGHSTPPAPPAPRYSRLRRSTLPPRLQILDPPLFADNCIAVD